MPSNQAVDSINIIMSIIADNGNDNYLLGLHHPKITNGINMAEESTPMKRQTGIERITEEHKLRSDAEHQIENVVLNTFLPNQANNISDNLDKLVYQNVPFMELVSRINNSKSFKTSDVIRFLTGHLETSQLHLLSGVLKKIMSTVTPDLYLPQLLNHVANTSTLHLPLQTVFAGISLRCRQSLRYLAIDLFRKEKYAWTCK